jgi:hypothetical protein
LNLKVKLIEAISCGIEEEIHESILIKKSLLSLAFFVSLAKLK